ncbi:transcriptional regulator, Crp/Fnr family [Desulfonatronospira thiodismutans ASO3-1]|uniref:Transcriptional regulator, Crp/Fnr family n=1 Tax=Desulfonatronospira thiodismutans ASO3-1 TaxID=555779 RepID=D6SS48_9BACT|nr:Crp/Fnr family transcriptional regulator [Desulfonatronospira thiodismutans]EFI33514.1 transcriptional regulator, Crp/Fnr family [Desulfonatronospira thiodismutans ASO3-1]
MAGTRHFKANQMIFQENDPGEGFYGIVQGKVKIYKSSPLGKEHILHIFGPGEIFAEVAVFAGRNFPASALCLEDTKLLFFPRKQFRRLISENPDLGLNLLGLLSMRLRNMVGKVEELSLKEVPARLATHLLLIRENLGKDQFDLDLNKSQLAGFLGTIPETLSRVIRKMNEEEYIETAGKKVTLLDISGLEDLAAGNLRL